MNPVMAGILSVAGPLALKSVPQRAATEVFVATHPSVSGVSGANFVNSNEARRRVDSEDAELGKRLWDVSEKIVAGLP